MSRETYDQYLRRPGPHVDPKRVTAFDRHARACATCSAKMYGYLECAEGTRLAAEAVRPLDNSR